MNMNKALQHLYKAVSGEDTTKRNISKLLVDIHTALTGEAPENKNNHAKIIDSMAENWSGGGGGGGSSIVEPIVVTINNTSAGGKSISVQFTDADMNRTAFHLFNGYIDTEDGTIQADAGSVATDTVYCLPNKAFMLADFADNFSDCTLSGGAEFSEVMGMTVVLVTGDCTITVS